MTAEAEALKAEGNDAFKNADYTRARVRACMDTYTWDVVRMGKNLM